MNKEPMSDSDFKILMKTLNDAKNEGFTRGDMAYITIGAFEALNNMTHEQIAALRPFLYGD